MRDDTVESPFQSFLQEALMSSSGMGRDVHSLMLSIRHLSMAILLSARFCCRLSWERWLRPLHLLGPVLLWCCQLQLTSLYSIIVLQPPLLCEGWAGHPLCLSGVKWWIFIDLVIVEIRAVFCPSVRYLSFFCEAFSWTILDGSTCSLFHSVSEFNSKSWR